MGKGAFQYLWSQASSSKIVLWRALANMCPYNIRLNFEAATNRSMYCSNSDGATKVSIPE